MPSGADARCAMHAEAVVALGSKRRLAGMNTDPNLHLCPLWPVVRGEGTLTRDRRCHSLLGSDERNKEGITLRPDLAPAVLLKGRAKQSMMLREYVTVTVPQLDRDSGRTLDIAEQQRDGTAGQLRLWSHRTGVWHVVRGAEHPAATTNDQLRRPTVGAPTVLLLLFGGQAKGQSGFVVG